MDEAKQACRLSPGQTRGWSIHVFRPLPCLIFGYPQLKGILETNVC
jgi:hypothetical protein